jgi:hypothetical protein
METIRSIFIHLVILTFVFAQLPISAMASENQTGPPKEATQITKNSPRILTTTEERIPTEKPKGSKVLWAVAGTALLVGLVAAFAGGGGGGENEPDPDPGSVSVGW